MPHIVQFFIVWRTAALKSQSFSKTKPVCGQSLTNIASGFVRDSYELSLLELHQQLHSFIGLPTCVRYIMNRYGNWCFRTQPILQAIAVCHLSLKAGQTGRCFCYTAAMVIEIRNSSNFCVGWKRFFFVAQWWASHHIRGMWIDRLVLIVAIRSKTARNSPNTRKR